MSEISITMHLAAEALCPEGKAQLLCAPRDYRTLKEFLRKHFDLSEATTNDVGERYFIRLPRYEDIEDEKNADSR